MTRLDAADIAQVGTTLRQYERELTAKTGCDLIGLACRAAGISRARFKRRAAVRSVGLVPVTTGQGVIPGFCEAVADILSHIGGRVFITQKPDAAGLAESVERGADIFMLADDDRFVAIGLDHGRVVDNSIATGRVFAEGLSCMSGGLEGRQALVIGCGPVGCSAAETLAKEGARMAICDVHPSICRAFKIAFETSMKTDIRVIDDPAAVLGEIDLVLDASPAENLIKAHHITPATCVSAPGVPLGLDEGNRGDRNSRNLDCR